MRAEKRRIERAAKKSGDAIFEVRRVFIQLEVTMLDPVTLKVRDQKIQDPATVCEADFFPGLEEFIRAYMKARGAKVQNLQAVPKPAAQTA